MENRPIRVTMFWADENALLQDWRSGHTRKMVDWANEFFARYFFELDVQPDPYGKIADAQPYCLVKSGGYEPDQASWDEVFDRWMNERLKYYVPWGRTISRILELEEQEKAKRRLVDAARAAVRALPAGDPGLPAAQAKLDELLIEYIEITREISDRRAQWEKQGKELDAFDETFVVELEERNFQKKPRLQLGQKIIESFPLSAVTRIKSKSENPYIFGTDRLKILNVRMRSPLSMRVEPSQVFGVTLPPLGFNHVNGRYLWDGWLIMLNLLKYEQITLAHEIVHAAGRGHVRPKIRVGSIPRWISRIRQDYAGNLIVPSLYEYETLSAYRDGPNNDIINYNAKGKKAGDVILDPADATNLAESDFVKVPSPPFTGPIVLPK